MRRIKRKIIVTRALVGVLVLVAILWSMIPLYNVIIVSLSPGGEFPTKLFEISPRLTPHFYYKILFTEQWSILPYLKNSIVVAVMATLIVMALGIPAAYAFSRSRARETRLLFYALLVFLTTPFIAPLLPFFLFIRQLHLMDTLLGIALAHIAWNLPLAIWLMRGFFDMIPTDMEEAAMIDGASRLRTMVQIVLPISAPGVSVAAVYVFMFSYIEYMYAMTLSRQQSATLPVKIAGYVVTHMVYFQEVAAAITISLIPMVVLYALIQKWFVKGLTLGAVKY